MRKALVAAIVLLLLAILCLAFIGIFRRFPDEWEWVGVVLAGLGIAMATPSILQMFWGRACIETKFEVSAKGHERSLVILLKNPPMRNRILKTLGVKRETVQSLTAAIRISEFGSKKIIVPIRHARLFTDEDTSSDKWFSRIVLPPTYSAAATIMAARWDNGNKRAIILGDILRQPLLLSEGYYNAQIIILVDGEHNEISRQFVVGKNADDLIWTNPPQSK